MHRCGVCEGKRQQPTNPRRIGYCPIIDIYEKQERAAIATLKRTGAWRGKRWFEALQADYRRILGALMDNEMRVRRSWSVQRAILAEAILDGRATAEAADLIEK